MLQAKHNPEVKARLESRLRDDIGDLLPAGQKSLVADHPVEMWDTKRFEEFTGSRTGQAVVIIKDGRPTVIVKQGADPREIAQEGFHLVQAIDPTTRAKVARLDESVMSRWSSLDVREKLVLYKEKLDLELDAQRKMVAALEERAGAARALDDPDIVDRLARAKETLGNLEKRAGDLGRIGPLERQLLAWGVLQPAPWLDQPARLFAKAPAPAAKKVAKAKKKRPPPPPMAPEDVWNMARHADHFAVDIEDAYAKGVTIERVGDPLALSYKEHSRLTGQLEEMRAARRAYQETLDKLAVAPDPAAFEKATKAWHKMVSDTNEVMRSFGNRFEITSKPPHGSRGQGDRPCAGQRATPPQQARDGPRRAHGLRASDPGGRPARRADGPDGSRAQGDAERLRDSRRPTTPSWLGRRLAQLLDGYERAHLIGPGFGAEDIVALMLAPHSVNQFVQNKWIEKVLRKAAERLEVNIVAVARGREIAIPLANGKFDYVKVLDEVTYFLKDVDGKPMRFKNALGQRVPMSFTIEIEPGRGWKASSTCRRVRSLRGCRCRERSDMAAAPQYGPAVLRLLPEPARPYADLRDDLVRLGWEWANESQELPLVPGEPEWVAYRHASGAALDYEYLPPVSLRTLVASGSPDALAPLRGLPQLHAADLAGLLADPDIEAVVRGLLGVRALVWLPLLGEVRELASAHPEPLVRQVAQDVATQLPVLAMADLDRWKAYRQAHPGRSALLAMMPAEDRRQVLRWMGADRRDAGAGVLEALRTGLDDEDPEVRATAAVTAARLAAYDVADAVAGPSRSRTSSSTRSAWPGTP